MNRLLLRDIKRKLNIWSVLSILGVIMVLLPSLSIFVNLLTPASENWLHIKEYLNSIIHKQDYLSLDFHKQ